MRPIGRCRSSTLRTLPRSTCSVRRWSALAHPAGPQREGGAGHVPVRLRRHDRLPPAARLAGLSDTLPAVSFYSESVGVGGRRRAASDRPGARAAHPSPAAGDPQISTAALCLLPGAASSPTCRSCARTLDTASSPGPSGVRQYRAGCRSGPWQARPRSAVRTALPQPAPPLLGGAGLPVRTNRGDRQAHNADADTTISRHTCGDLATWACSDARGGTGRSRTPRFGGPRPADRPPRRRTSRPHGAATEVDTSWLCHRRDPARTVAPRPLP